MNSAPSRQTLDARAAARDDADRWQEHVSECPQCARSRHSRGRRPPCPRGGRLLMWVTQSAERLAAEIREDAKPNPDQEVLF
jgi:hypothetical protein